MTKNEYIQYCKHGILKPFDKRLWQRNYWERIIRNDIEFHYFREYIKNNPAEWKNDKLYCY